MFYLGNLFPTGFAECVDVAACIGFKVYDGKPFIVFDDQKLFYTLSICYLDIFFTNINLLIRNCKLLLL